MPYNDELLFERDLINYLQQSCGWKDGLINNPTEEDLIKKFTPEQMKEYLERNFIANEDGFCHICKIDKHNAYAEALED